jgi:hypothetical protein
VEEDEEVHDEEAEGGEGDVIFGFEGEELRTLLEPGKL